MKKFNLFSFLVVLLGTCAFGQVSSGTVTNRSGQPIGGALIAVCSANPGTVVTGCPSSLVTTYTDETLTVACVGASGSGLTSGVGCSNPGKSNGLGNYNIFTKTTGIIFSQIYGNSITTSVTPFVSIPSGLTNFVRIANLFPGSDLGAQVNAADVDLGSNSGSIWAFNGGSICTQIVISPNHKLFLFNGTYTPCATVTTSYLQAFPIALQSNSSLECASWNTILVEPTQVNIWTIVAPFNAMNTSGARGTDSNVSIKGCHFTGAHASFNSAPSTVGLGNCVHCSVTNSWFDGTRTLQLTAGGSSVLGNHAIDVWATDNLFTQSSTQSLSCVNCKDFHFNRNTFLDAGQVGGAGVTFIDLEPNSSTDWMEEGEIGDNIMDNLNGQNTTVGGITVQNAALALFGPISVHDNVIRGGSIDSVTSQMSAGIVVNSSTRDVSVTNNYVRRVQQNGIVAGGDRDYVSGNRLICVGSHSNTFWGISVLGTNSVFIGNTVVDPGTCAGSDSTITESGAANTNFYSNNIASQIITIGGASVVSSHIDSSGNFILGPLSFNSSIFGGIQLSALAQPTINSGGSGATTSGGGTLPNATYGYKVTATSISGETAGSGEVTKTTTGGQNAVSLLINGVSGALSYKIYGRTSGSGWAFIASIPAHPSSSNNTLTYVDLGTISPSGAVPTVDTSGLVKVVAAGFSGVEGTAPSAGIASSDLLWPDSVSHCWKINNNNSSSSGCLPQIITSGTSTMGVVGVNSANCAAVVTTAATGALATDTVVWAFASSPGTGDGLLSYTWYLTANNVNWKVCNASASTLSPSGLVINWKVIR